MPTRICIGARGLNGERQTYFVVCTSIKKYILVNYECG